MTAQQKKNDSDSADPRWKDLYRIGGIASLLLAGLIAFAVIAYFIWPYTPGLTSVADIFATLQSNRLEGLISLDLAVPVMLPILVLQMLALYVALKPVNESYALIALVFGIIGVILWLTVRPIAEMVVLSERYVAATSEGVRIQTLAAGETLSALFNGTAWMLSQIFIPTSYFISSMLMLRSQNFGKATAYIGIVNSIFGFGILAPGFVIAAIFGLGTTIVSTVWDVLLARDFFRLAKE